ncbi:MAG: ABC transporter substrate-binding protein [Trueperaceae bacterium]
MNPTRSIRTAALRRALLVVLACVGVAHAAWPVTVVDDLGRDVTLAAPPQRIVSLVPSHTETVCALDACDRLVGRDTWSDFPRAVGALPDLGSAFAPDLEAIVALRPDLVLVDEYSGAADVLVPLGLAVYAGTPQRLDELFATVDRLGRLLGAPTEAALLAGRLRGELDGVVAVVAGLAGPSVFYEVDPSPYSVGPASFIGTLIGLAGGRNVVPDDLGDFPLIDPEFVVAADPQVIVLADAPYGVDAAAVAARPGWGTIAAVRDGRVVELTQEQSDVMSRAGPRVGEALLLLARILHPGAF